MGALSLIFFSQKILLWGVFFYLSKAIGFGWAVKLKSLPIGVGSNLAARPTAVQIYFFAFLDFFFFSYLIFFSYGKEKINWWDLFILYKSWVMIIFFHLRLGWLNFFSLSVGSCCHQDPIESGLTTQHDPIALGCR
jgi:hypothetical protein